MVVSSFICLLNRFHWSKAVAALGLIISMSVRYRLTLCRQPKSKPCTCVHLPSMIYQNRHFTKNVFWENFCGIPFRRKLKISHKVTRNGDSF